MGPEYREAERLAKRIQGNQKSRPGSPAYNLQQTYRRIRSDAACRGVQWGSK